VGAVAAGVMAYYIVLYLMPRALSYHAAAPIAVSVSLLIVPTLGMMRFRSLLRTSVRQQLIGNGLNLCFSCGYHAGEAPGIRVCSECGQSLTATRGAALRWHPLAHQYPALASAPTREIAEDI
jgi:hypothetical protein